MGTRDPGTDPYHPPARGNSWPALPAAVRLAVPFLVVVLVFPVGLSGCLTTEEIARLEAAHGNVTQLEKKAAALEKKETELQSASLGTAEKDVALQTLAAERSVLAEDLAKAKLERDKLEVRMKETRIRRGAALGLAGTNIAQTMVSFIPQAAALAPLLALLGTFLQRRSQGIGIEGDPSG